MAKKPTVAKTPPAPAAEDQVDKDVNAAEEESLTDNQPNATDADVRDEVTRRMPSSEKQKKAREIVEVKGASDPLVAEPSTYQGIPLTAEEAAAHDPAKHILATQLSREETEAEDDEPEVVKGHITTDEERLALLLKQPDTAVQKARRGGQAPLQFANAKADNASERSDRIAAQVSDGVRKVVKGKL